MYKLRATLKGHESDVRDLTVAGSTLVSASRDGTVRSWSLSDSSNSIILNSSTNSFINAVCSLDDAMIASGGKDNIIFINSIAEHMADMGTYNLVGHANNICGLSSFGNTIISCSWDGTAKLWDTSKNECIATLNTDLGVSVLTAVIVEEGKYLTGAADRKIRLFHGEKLVQTFTGHSDVVRKLVVLNSDMFASCSNDGSVKIWSFSGDCITTLVGHESFVYDLILLPNGLLVSSGEDRTVRIWKNLSEISQVITLPCISNWCLSNLDNDIVVGSSDNIIRVFTQDPSKFADPQQLEQFEKSVESSAIAEQSVDINRTDVPGYERLEMAGTEGQTVMVKNNVGVIEAHQWSNGKWNKIGEVVGSSGSNSKKTYNGKEYDYVFDVDIEDGKPPLKLPFNAGENVYTVANKFLADNELPASYIQDVVKFLETNTQGVSLDAPSAPAAAPAAAPTTKSAALSVLPVKQLIFFDGINSKQLNKGLTKFNELNGGKMSHIPVEFDLSSSESVDLINSVVSQVFEWEPSAFLVGFDILRLVIRKLGISDILQDEKLPELILSFIEKGSKSNDPSVLMMFTKFLNNLVDSVLFLQIYITSEDTDPSKLFFTSELSNLLNSIKSSTPDKSHKHYNQFVTGFSTLIYNLSVLQITKKIKSLELENFIYDTGVEEANYRMLIALGNLKYIKMTSLPLPEWESQYQSQARFALLANDIKSL